LILIDLKLSGGGIFMEHFLRNKINKGSTIYVNLMRGIIAGIVWTLFLYTTSPLELSRIWVLAIWMPLGYFSVCVPIALISGWLINKGVRLPVFGIYYLLPAIIIFPGDPFMFLLHKISPKITLLPEYKIIEQRYIIWVYDES
jgi:hypothetical protein